MPSDPDACWGWTAAKKSTGYGRVRFQKREYVASRLSYSAHNGVDPLGMDVLHKCDNPECCNPRHLFLGTHQDNMRDAAMKGRQRGPIVGSVTMNRGEANGMSKLTDRDVSEIRRRYEAGEKQTDLAADFGVVRSRISVIVRGCKSRRPLKANTAEVLRLAAEGATNDQIGAQFGVTGSAVSKFRAGL